MNYIAAIEARTKIDDDEIFGLNMPGFSARFLMISGRRYVAVYYQALVF